MPSPAWTADQLRQLGGNEELVLVLTRRDKPVLRVPVWPVTVGDQAYVRSYLGVTSGWYRAVLADCNQQMDLDGDVPVCFESVAATDAVNADIDTEFLRKYATDDYRDAMVTSLALNATLRLLPR